MRRTIAVVHTEHAIESLPRGWVILGGALASWALFLALSSGLSQFFMLILASF